MRNYIFLLGLTLLTSASVFGYCTGPVIGDLNNDCKVDFADLATLALHWLENKCTPGEDCLPFDNPDDSGFAILVAASDSPADCKNRVDLNYLCDGIDDDVEINRAIHAGSKVTLCEGTYYGKFALDTNNVILEGMGSSTILKIPNGNAPHQVLTITGDHCTVRDLAINGNKAGQTFGVVPDANWRECDGIAIYGNYNTIEDCSVYNIVAHGIIVWSEATSGHNGSPNASKAAGGRSYNLIRNNYIHDFGCSAQKRSGIDVATSNTNIHNDIVGNKVFVTDANLVATGITLHGGSLCDIINNKIYSSQTMAAINIHTGAYGVQVMGNEIDYTYGGRVLQLCNSVSDVTIIGNTFNMTNTLYQTVGIQFLTGTFDGIVISGNIFKWAASLNNSPILLNTPTGLTMRNCSFTGNVVDGASTFFTTKNPTGMQDAYDIGYFTEKSELFMDVCDTSSDYVCSNQAVSGTIPITFTMTNAHPNEPRTLTWAFDSHTNITAYTLAFVGYDAKGIKVTETFNNPGYWSGETCNAFATIDSIKLTARTGTGDGDTIDIGIGSKVGLSSNIYYVNDVLKVKKNGADMAPGSYTVNTAYDTVDLSTGGAIVGGTDYTIYYKEYLNIIK